MENTKLKTSGSAIALRVVGYLIIALAVLNVVASQNPAKSHAYLIVSGLLFIALATIVSKLARIEFYLRQLRPDRDSENAENREHNPLSIAP